MSNDKPCNSLKCELYTQCQSPMILASGSSSPDLLVIGDAPYVMDDRQRGSFLGDGGDWFKTLLVQVGFDLKKVAFTTVVKCRPRQDKYGKEFNREPLAFEIKDCKPYLLEDIERLKPKAILTLGAVAFKAVMNQTGIMSKHGSVLDLNGTLLVPTFHPVNVLRDDSFLSDFAKDVETLHREMYVGKLVTRPVEYHLLKSIPDLKRLIIRASQADECSFDLETSCLNPFLEDAQIVCAAFSFVECESYVIPLYHKQMLFTGRTLNYAKEVIREIMESDLPKIGQNAKFDISWLKVTEGIETNNLVFDTMLAQYLLSEIGGTHSLDYLAWRYVPDMGGYDLPLEEHKKLHKDCDPKRGGSYRNIEWPVLFPYAAMDTDCTIRVKHILEKLL